MGVKLILGVGGVATNRIVWRVDTLFVMSKPVINYGIARLYFLNYLNDCKILDLMQL